MQIAQLQKKLGSFIRLRRVILLRSDIRHSPSGIRCRERKRRIKYHENRKVFISLPRSRQYHSDEVGISLDGFLFWMYNIDGGDIVSNSILRDRAKEFAKKMVFLCRDLKEEHKEAVLINQLLRSGTSIGANIHEAQYAQGTKDFISKLEIAQKECFETEYWLEILFETGCIEEAAYRSIQNDCGAIRRMLIASLKTVKAKQDQSIG